MSTIKKQVSVIILTFNSENYIEKCLLSVQKNANYIKEVLVIDNNSKDNTVELIKRHKFVKLIRNNINAGFSVGVNIGIKHSSGKKVLILNPDTIIHPNSIARLVQCAFVSKASIAGGRLIKSDGSYHNTFVRRPDILTGLFDFTNLRKVTPFDWFHKRHYYLDEHMTDKVKNVDAVSGAFMLVDRDVFQKIGLFDENFFMYLEDIDFCIRAKRMGLGVVFCPGVKIYHEGGASSRNADKINHHAWEDSRSYYFKKHFGAISNIIIQPIFAIDNLLVHTWIKLKYP